MNETDIHFVDADERLKTRIADEWCDLPARHMHITDGFSIVAIKDESPVGLISVYWKQLPPPLPETSEGFIDILEVRKDFRRRGLAAKLIEMSTKRARKKGVHQLRSWSSEDKVEAVPMWKALGFCLCPATAYPRGQEVKGYFVAKVL